MKLFQRPSLQEPLIVVSFIIFVLTVFVYLVSSQNYTWDFLGPLIGTVQLLFAVGIFYGKLWGLIGYTMALIAVFVLIGLQYSDKLDVAIKTSLVFAPLAVLNIFHWIKQRDRFSWK